MIVVHNGQAPT